VPSIIKIGPRDRDRSAGMMGLKFTLSKIGEDVDTLHLKGLALANTIKHTITG
jgi:hypothetical protein